MVFKRRIFISNALMVLVTLFILLIINVVFLKVYSEYIEHGLEDSIEGIVDEDGLEELLEGYTIRRDEFILLFLADGILCIAVLVIVSQIFTRKLVNHSMEPLDALADGAERIRKSDLTQDIEYSGDAEFENVCHTFNEMRGAILAGQEKNRKYEKARTDMITGTWTGITGIDGKTLLFLVLSGLATGASWLCYFHTLQGGPASVVVLIDKLSILITVAFSWVCSMKN